MPRAKTLTKPPAEGRERQAQRAHPGPRPFLAGNLLNAVLCVVLAAVTIAVYSPLNDSAFIHWDAENLVTGNPHIQDGLSWSTLKWAFTSIDAWNWQPLTWISHAVDYQFFASNPGGHHFASVLIHALNAVVLFLLLVWMTKTKTTKRVGPSLFVAALFALHPLNVESVAWIAERKNVLCTLFFFLAIVVYVRYAQKPNWQRYLLVAALFAAGLMAKSMVITLPFVFLLLDYWPLERMSKGVSGANSDERTTWTKLALEKIPLLLLSAASAWITVIAQRSGESIASLQQFPLPLRIENALVAYCLYLWKMFWPAQLALFYPHPGSALPARQWILSALILIGITVLAIIFRGKGYLPIGWFWFLGTLIPVIGLVQVGRQSMADRYAYIPLIGIFIMIAWGLDDWANAKQVPAVWRTVPALCVLTALAFVTARQVGYWKNEYTLWAHTLAVTERNSLAHDTLGAALMDPDMASTASTLDGLDTEQKRMTAARQHWEQALELNRQLSHPDDQTRQFIAMELSDLGYLDRIQNRTDDAHQRYEEALAIYRQLAFEKPKIYLSRVTLTLDRMATVDRLRNRPDEALLHYDETLTIKRQLAQQNPAVYMPDLALTLNEVGLADALQNHSDEARRHFEEALGIQRQLADQNPALYLPYIPKTLNNLANLDRQQNRIDESRAEYQEALNLLRKLSQLDSKYADDMAKVEASLRELNNNDNGSQEKNEDANPRSQVGPTK